MKKLCILLSLLSVFLSCQTKPQKDNVLKNNEYFSAKDSLYEDYDLFSFRPINHVKYQDKHSSFLKVINEKDESKILMSIDNDIKELLLKKEKNLGYYIHTQSFEQDYVKEYLYTVFSKNIIITFVLNRYEDQVKKTLTSYRVLFPLNKKTFLQRELIFKLKDSIVITEFEEIDIEGFLKKKIADYESEYFYKFNTDNNSCVKYYHDVESGKLIFESEYNVFNSKSMASPYYYYYWKVKK
ncbi:hypothetical protein [Flavobacterium cerinum]|uniref:Lipoprotein n=1 Tax=Flavobacterium cerinum TaxID=2502784 RepID=A0ABY5IYX2_9FLAO|nr:hypothetical protein [Flavobacterium cerinum]UUC46712.1 hypothetical protein NOX80_05805 [Flavobacterium cerinum]